VDRTQEVAGSSPASSVMKSRGKQAFPVLARATCLVGVTRLTHLQPLGGKVIQKTKVPVVHSWDEAGVVLDRPVDAFRLRDQ
jgi:hypothetical protein